MSFFTKIGFGLMCIGAIPILIGFGPSGIIGGSIAAGIQSLIGNVSAGSIFATMTSYGMSGIYTSIIGIGGIFTGIGQFFKSKKNDEEKVKDKSKEGTNICNFFLFLIALFIIFFIYKKWCITKVDKENST